MDIGALTPQPAQGTGSAGVQKGADQGSVIPKPENSVTQTPVPSVDKVDLQAAEKKRMAAMRQAISRSQSFAVRDTSFAIFKDASGQLVTRFTSLRDGSVTYIPEPDIMKRLSSPTASQSFIHLNA